MKTGHYPRRKEAGNAVPGVSQRIFGATAVRNENNIRTGVRTGTVRMICWRIKAATKHQE